MSNQISELMAEAFSLKHWLKGCDVLEVLKRYTKYSIPQEGFDFLIVPNLSSQLLDLKGEPIVRWRQNFILRSNSEAEPYQFDDRIHVYPHAALFDGLTVGYVEKSKCNTNIDEILCEKDCWTVKARIFKFCWSTDPTEEDIGWSCWVFAWEATEKKIAFVTQLGAPWKRIPFVTPLDTALRDQEKDRYDTYERIKKICEATNLECEEERRERELAKSAWLEFGGIDYVVCPVIASNLTIDAPRDLDSSVDNQSKLEPLVHGTECYASPAPPMYQELCKNISTLNDGSDFYKGLNATLDRLALDGVTFGFIRAGSKTNIGEKIKRNQKIRCYMLCKVQENPVDDHSVASVTWRFIWGRERSWESIAKERLKMEREEKVKKRQKESMPPRPKRSRGW